MSDELSNEAQNWAQKLARQGYLSFSELPGCFINNNG